jgi:serine/threonine protein kinase
MERHWNFRPQPGGAATTLAMNDLTGQRIQDYVIEEEVGRGGMARVYRAHHRVLDRVSALKVLLPELAGDANFVERFLREARAAARLEHPNIVPIYETGRTADGHYFLAMKYVEGATLRQVINRGAPDLQAVVAYVSQIAAALDYAHENGIVHRDIKPGNVLVDNDGGVLLTDFGIAQAAEDINVTSQGMLVGTPAYMSPEQAQGFPATAQSDIYSLGVVVYELLTGTTPFPHRTPHAVLLGHISEPPLPVHDRNPNLTPEMSAVIGKALAKSPDDRYRTAGEFAAALATAAGERPSISLPEAVATPTHDSPTVIEQPLGQRLHPRHWISERGRWFVAGVVVMAVVMIIASWIFGPTILDSDSTTASGTLTVNSVPPGADLSVNGVPVGSAPRAVTDLPEGEHVLLAELPSYAPVERTITVGEDGDDDVTLILQPLPPAATLEVIRATMTHAVARNAQGIEEPVDTAVAFAPDEDAIAFAFVISSAHNVRDIEFTFQSRWYGPDGTLRSSSRPTMVTLDRSGEVWHLTARDRAGEIDPLVSGEPCTVELLVDDVVIQTLQFRVEERP